MPYFEVGKSRRYIDRRLGLTVSMAFIVIMLYSNWMGSPEYLVASSPEQEVFQDILPQEGHSELKAVPFDELRAGTYLPGQSLGQNQYHLMEALVELEESVFTHSCHLSGGNPLELPECTAYEAEDGSTKYRTYYTRDAMPDPEFRLIIKPVVDQTNMMQLIITAQVEDPSNPGEFLIDNQIVAYRHADSNYEED